MGALDSTSDPSESAHSHRATYLSQLSSMRSTAIATPLRQTRITSTPSDPLFNQQWYLHNTGQTGGTPGVDLNVVDVWRDYTGAGVTVGILDDSVQYIHPDLQANYNTAIDFDVAEQDGDPAPGTFDFHGTSVAGIIAAQANNGIGGVGVAPDATIAAIRMDFDGYFGSYDQDAEALAKMSNFDVVNNSWGYSYPFSDDFSDSAFDGNRIALQSAAQNGRHGLGTVVVFAAGNEREYGDNANYHNQQNSRFVTTVAALTHKGKHTSYSSPGANVLVSAFGGEDADRIVTTDRLGTPGYNLAATPDQASDYTDDFGGTSAATPMVTGIAALMLQANPSLGYRDVQEILAYSARQNDASSKGWAINGATNWNGGGLHVNHDYGFGLVDAHAAVRLAETWTAQSTYANEKQVSVSRSPNLAIPDGTGAATDSVRVGSGLAIDHVEVGLNIKHPYIGDLEVTLTSPDGTKSILVNRPGVTAEDRTGQDTENLKFTCSTTHDWGETGAGTWKLTVRDRLTGQVGTLKSWSLQLYGDSLSSNNTYIYTNEFANYASDRHRSTLSDTSGTDTLNAAAITSNSDLNLTPGSHSTLAGKSLTIRAGSVIENAFGGDGNDTITGNTANNALAGGRGNDTVRGANGNDSCNGNRGSDTLIGGNGNDILTGEAGDDRLTGGNGSDRFLYATGSAFTSAALGSDTITDFDASTDQLILSKTTFSALTSRIGNGFSAASEFASVLSDAAAAVSNALIVYSSATGRLFYNQNGSEAGYGSGAAFATLKGSPFLVAHDFVLQA
jgi:subtilisin-like proprotein convertase family protein